MANNYLPYDDAGKMKWLNNFSGKAPMYKDVLRLEEDVVQQLVQDAANFDYFISNLNSIREYKKQSTAYKNILRDGSRENMPLQPPAAPPAAPKPPYAVVPDIFGRTSKLVASIKANRAYNESIGKDLGIIGQAPVINKVDVQPSLQYEMNAGHPVLKWKKNKMQGVHLYVDRGDGKGNNFLATSTRALYKDSYPLPSLGQSAIWKFTAIYIDNDEEVGQMSTEVKLTVSGIS